MQKLTCQKSPEVSGDADMGDKGKDKCQTDQQADDIHHEDTACLTQPLQDAGEGSVQIDKRTYKPYGGDKMSGKFAVKKCFAEKIAEKSETAETDKP